MLVLTAQFRIWSILLQGSDVFLIRVHILMEVYPLPHRDDVLQSLSIVQHCLLGAGCMLPPLDGPPVSGL